MPRVFAVLLRPASDVRSGARCCKAQVGKASSSRAFRNSEVRAA